jgi:enamine deaminase RidA (YjgF/YER057c/UK114 family)
MATGGRPGKRAPRLLAGPFRRLPGQDRERREPYDRGIRQLRQPRGDAPPHRYTHVVEVTAGRPVYISGQVALDANGDLVGPGDVGVRARQVFESLQAALRSVGAGFEQVVKLNVYLVDATQMPAVRQVRDDLLVAVDAVAILPS